MPAAPVAVPKRPGGRPVRLDSLKNPLPRLPPHMKRPSRSQRMAASRECPNPDCTDRDVGEEHGQLVCRGCGTVVNDSNIVSEVLFGETSSGKQMVQGGHVGADQSYARSAQPMNHRVGGGLDSREMTEATGRRYVNQLGAALTIGQSLIDSGMQIFKLAAANNFIQGRRTKSVAAVCLYIACRIQKDSNRIMLIDFSDVLMLNVFKLGHIYKALIDELRINGNGFTVHPINPEDLILRFANRLEFGSDTMRVANDAVRIVQRFHRDWMTPGRRPAGVCGAALILAARMNDFRRTTREMVYVAKVSEATLQKRLDEFKITESSNLTVEEFRNIDLEQSCDPPAFYEQTKGKKKSRKRRHDEIEDDGDSGTESQGIGTTTSPLAASYSASENREASNDRLRMPPPPIPIDPALIQVSAQSSAESAAHERSSAASAGIDEPPAKRKRGRSRKSSQNLPLPSSSTSSTTSSPQSSTTVPKPKTRTEKERVSESALPEHDLTSLLSPPTSYNSAAALQRVLEATSDETSLTSPPRRPIPSSETISEEEYASDPEVINCLLTPAEFAIKERIWTHENRDFLREQQNKLMRQQLAEANGTARPVLKRQRRRGRMGDMSAYRDGDGADDDGGQIASSPAEAAMKMLKKRAFSKKINYEMLKEIYEPSAAPTPSHSTPSSPSPSSSPPPPPPLSPGAAGRGAGAGGTTTPKITNPQKSPDSHQNAQTTKSSSSSSHEVPGREPEREPRREGTTTTAAAVNMNDDDDDDDGGEWNESELEDEEEGGGGGYEEEEDEGEDEGDEGEGMGGYEEDE